jgi:hypothetical protein
VLLDLGKLLLEMILQHHSYRWRRPFLCFWLLRVVLLLQSIDAIAAVLYGKG